MSAAVDHVHHRHRHLHGTHAAQIAVKGQADIVGSRTGASHGNTQNGVGTEIALIFRTVVFNHLSINGSLLRHIKPDQCGLNLGMDVFHSLHDTLAAVTSVLVTQFKRFTDTGGGAGRNSCAAHHTAVKIDVAFHRGVAAAIQNFTSDDGIDRRHIGSSSKIDFGGRDPAATLLQKYNEIGLC